MALEELPGPFELSKIDDRQSVVMSVVDYKVGTMLIHPTGLGAPAEKRIRVVRIWVPQEEKAMGLPYWDLTSQTLIAQLLPMLPELKKRQGKVKITAYGVAPSKRFTVEVL